MTIHLLLVVFGFILLNACSEQVNTDALPLGHRQDTLAPPLATTTSLIVLGNVQDAGSPHAACRKDCCADLFAHPDPTRRVVSLGVAAPADEANYLFEASPDLSIQMKWLKQFTGTDHETPSGIFLTHAHIGHYAGLMYLGKEAMNADSVPTYVMPRMEQFLTQNGPWGQLVSTGNVKLSPLRDGRAVTLDGQVVVTPFLVPHRDEYSETVGYRISGPRKTAIFLPDIDKWEKFATDINRLIESVDYAFLDATFFDAAELNTRDISQIPHPFVVESLARFASLSAEDRNKVHFIHFNHTNRLLDPRAEETRRVEAAGMHVARLFDVFEL
ncbi:MBL fold metallo-hydrolase [Lewinella sp. W8]|uniref:MBL fold metallo-hydrolase n=1 Tax=Lewinella sp. W8 TaxID=2528208 RepID=UPI001068974E|nr:MBL fold metallo-hydrolase [Lewinella sp. W8]MTB52263.1 pyrroloquinoline quinone biosynthesis protein PqqB [Lewinella sp. W8]